MSSRSPKVREIAATPAQLRALAARQPQLFPALFDSTALGALGRYSILAAAPSASLLLRGDGRLECQGVTLRNADFLGALDEWWQSQRSPAGATSPEFALPFRGGWIVYLAYETADRIESGLHLPALNADRVCAMAMRVPVALVYDHERSRCYLSVEAGATDAGAAVERALAGNRAPDENPEISAARSARCSNRIPTPSAAPC